MNLRIADTKQQTQRRHQHPTGSLNQMVMWDTERQRDQKVKIHRLQS
jgi:hypothetical protein